MHRWRQRFVVAWDRSRRGQLDASTVRPPTRLTRSVAQSCQPARASSTSEQTYDWRDDTTPRRPQWIGDVGLQLQRPDAAAAATVDGGGRPLDPHESTRPGGGGGRAHAYLQSRATHTSVDCTVAGQQNEHKRTIEKFKILSVGRSDRQREIQG
jgi:hypothetical protein